MKYVILFKGGVETQEFFSVEMAKEFEKEGFGIYWYDLILQMQSSKNLRHFYEEHHEDQFYAFTFNFNGIAGEAGLYEVDGNFWDETGIPVVNMVVDHPLYYQKYEHMIPKNYKQISIDQNHDIYMKRFFPEIPTGGFMPLGGTELNAGHAIMQNCQYLPMQNRPINVVFTGNYTPVSILRKHLEGMDQEYQNFYDSILEEVKNNPDCLVEEVAERRLKEELGELSDDQLKECMPNMMYVDLAVRFYYRGLAVAALADHGVPIHTFGAGWNLLECRHPENIIQAGSVDSLKCLEVISQAKISLNVMPWFKAGAHDRIFNSMLNGAVCLTDVSSYINANFINGEQIVVYSLEMLRNHPDQIADYVKGLLSNQDLCQKIADAGYRSCVNIHSWQERTKKIIDIFEQMREASL